MCARPELYASTPLLKALKVVLSGIATDKRGGEVVALTRESACQCVWRGCIKGEYVVATVHGDDTTIGGEQSAVEFLIKMISRKYEIKKQVIGEDPDFEKSGRILNRVPEWDRDGITIEADQRHVREIKALSWNERTNLRLRAPWKGEMKEAQEMMRARERTNADGD